MKKNEEPRAPMKGSLKLRDQAAKFEPEKTVYFSGYDILGGGVLEISEPDGKKTLFGPGYWEKFSFKNV
jgi:hypothetical protein